MLNEGDEFIHESIIEPGFIGRVEQKVKLGGYDTIIPSIEGDGQKLQDIIRY